MTNAAFSKILLVLIASVALACAPHEALAQRWGRGFGGGGAFHGGGFRGGFVGVSGGFGGFRGGFGRFGGFPRPFFGPGFRGSFGFGFGFGFGPWPYYPYYPYYPFYPYYWCGPYGSYSCGPLGYGPYASYSGDPVVPPAAPTGSQVIAAPSTGNAYAADGRWHRFGESPGGGAPASSATAIAYSRASDPAFAHNASVADGRWHRFSESR